MSHFWTTRRYPRWWRFLWCPILFSLGVAIALCFSLPGKALPPDLLSQLPDPQVHPLPATLVTLPEDTTQDYFAAIAPSPVGHLVWSKFPVQIYRPELDRNTSPNEHLRQTQWQTAIDRAIAEWSPYLPLALTTNPKEADITFVRERPPVQITLDPETQERRYSFARNAETRYQFYVDDQNYLRHRMTITLSPHQGAIATLNTARHELGHALGIWGHSPTPSDALYYSQNQPSTTITAADILTLKKIYQQPTRLGWQLPQPLQ